MKNVIMIMLGLLFIMFTVGCGNAEFGVNQPECETETVGNEYVTTCTNGTVINIPIPPPPQDGVDGDDGAPGAVLASVDVAAGQCVEVSPGIWAENIQNGRLADIYLNDSCSDSKGEFCDNLIPSYGRSGVLSDHDHEGSGTTCWAGNILITAHKELESSTTLSIKLIDFN